MSRALEFLRVSQNADGGWGYKPGGMSFVEPTAAVIGALSQDAQNTDAVQRARTLLRTLQHADGGWGIAAPDEESGWMTSCAVSALGQGHKDDFASAGRGTQWLLKSSGVRIQDPTEIERTEKLLQIDARVTGWAWQQGDAAWIYPTASALMALDVTQEREHPRVQEGIQYLLDRAIATGGWNIGNPFMVTGNMPPTVENTAYALIALRAYGIENDTTLRAAGWLAQDNFTPTAFEWAWRALYWAGAQERHAVLLEKARRALNGLQRADGSWDNNVLTTSLAYMALGTSEQDK